ncbi:PepSY-associated TM helix domain-containing protein [Dongia sp.]|uniref:PepSY-associated TM helix domain-containing protein n=1 Tax=Dongia sp. TaxID=1977262 RepID=UPI0035B4EF37
MRSGFRAAMAWLHDWAGLVFGWLLFAIFLTGAVSYFRQEISLWMRPELPAVRPVSTGDAIDAALGRLRRIGPGAERWMIELPDARDPAAHIYVWQDRAPAFQREMIDPQSGAPFAPRATHGGDFLYYFHFDLQMPGVWGRLLVGIAAMAMLVAIVSGIITHRRIFADFFTFRPWVLAPRAWLDGHNMLGVLALPYHLTITYSGLVIFMFLYLPWGIERYYGGDFDAFEAEALGDPPAATGPTHPAPLADLAPLANAVERSWRDGAYRPRIGRIEIAHPGRSDARIVLIAGDSHHVSHARGRVVIDGVGGHILHRDDALDNAASTFHAFYGLHLARFADPWLRWIFFLSGLGGSGMIATGLVLWVSKRRGRMPAAQGLRLVEGLNVGTIAGLIIAIGAFLAANRLLPLAINGRADAEAGIFFGAWALAFAHAFLRRCRSAWRAQLGVAGALYCALPAINALTTQRGLQASLAAADWPMAGVDLAALATGLCLLALARIAGCR